MSQFIHYSQEYSENLWRQISNPSWGSYFYALVVISLFFWFLEIVIPWRKTQRKFRRDFFLDAFYMFFNVFIFPLICFYALSKLFEKFVLDQFFSGEASNIILLDMSAWPLWLQIFIFFLARDFVHFNIHRLLHRVPFLWQFHKVHHSVREMGFAAHLRYHWSENVFYRCGEYLPLAMLGATPEGYMLVHFLTLAIGHFNHSNIKIPLGPLKYLLNNPQMHIWHHAKVWPNSFRYGINFGLTLSIWDYIFKTACIPEDGRDIELGFEDVESFPEDFVSQTMIPMKLKK